MAPSDTQTLDSIVTSITTVTSITALAHTLRNSIPKEARDVILSSSMSGGQDPLSVLDFRANTLGVLFIL